MSTDLQQEIWQDRVSRLDKALAESGLVRSRSQANELISGGSVRVNDSVVRKSGFKVAQGDTISVSGGDHYVSRAAHKLLAGLEAFEVSVSGKRCADVGASTGGFTQVLLERGANNVLAIDVGHDQLDALIRNDARVQVFEGCNARDMTAEIFGTSVEMNTQPELVVADLSFISLRLVLRAMVGIAAEDADFVLLVKPQFEVGRLGIKGGIVSDPDLAAEAVVAVLTFAEKLGLGIHGVIHSPIAGSHGNQEFVVHFSKRSDFGAEVWLDTIRDIASATIGKVGVANPLTAGSDD